MKQIKLIGVPVPVSERGHRIVLNSRIRKSYDIPKSGSVLMEYTPAGWIRILPQSALAVPNALKKSISCGRFNLPKDWAGSNRIHTGEFVHLVMTNQGLLICPANIPVKEEVLA